MLPMGHMIPVPLQANWQMRRTLMMLLPNMEKTTPTRSMKTTCLPLKVQQMVGINLCDLYFGKVEQFFNGCAILKYGTYVLYKLKCYGFFFNTVHYLIIHIYVISQAPYIALRSSNADASCEKKP